MSVLNYIVNHWLAIGFIAPISWALMNILDVYIVQEIYENEYEATIIGCIFQILPIIIMLIVVIILHTNLKISWSIIVLASIGGMLLTVSTLYYFKAMFEVNDAPTIEIILNFSIVLVPIVAFFLLKERLLEIQYVGIALTFIGGFIFVLQNHIERVILIKILKPMFFAIIALALSMVVEEKMFRNTDFLSGYFVFSISCVLTGISILIHKRKDVSVKRVFLLSKKHFWLFLLAETLAIIGITSSQKAIEISPSPSFIAVLESMQPIFTMLFSLIIVLFSREAQETFVKQLYGWKGKMFAIFIMGGGIYLIT